MKPTHHHYGPGHSQVGELWLPPAAPPSAGHPVAVVIHGGFWKAIYGKRLMHAMCRALAAADMAVWNIEYRRVGALAGGGWPATFEDVAAAVDHLVALAPGHHLDLSRVVTIGHSAGGHLALWSLARPRLPVPPPAVAPRGAISLAGVADLDDGDHLGLGGGAVARLMGGSASDHPDRYTLGSPSRLLPFGRPQVLVHGLDDATVPFAISERYAERARQAGDDVTLHRLEGVGHMELITPAGRSWETITAGLHALLG